MKIAFITSEKLPVPPVRGGAVEKWIYEVAKGLNGHDVYSFCWNDPLLADYPQDEGFRAFFYKKGLLGTILLSTYKLPFKNEETTLFFFPYAVWASRKMRQLGVQIIHNHSQPQFVPALRFFNPSAKIILHVHNVSVIDFNGKLWKKSLFDKVDLVVTCSRYLQKEVITRYPYLKGKTKVISNGIDLDVFDPEKVDSAQVEQKRAQYHIQQGDWVLLYAGRLVAYKGVHVLIDAVRQLLPRHPRLKLLILGGLTYSNNTQTPYIQKLKESADALKDNIIFTGYVDHRHIPTFMALCDIFVVPSLWEEPFGVINIEAMAMRKPVVAFAKGGIKEIISPNVNGILVEDATPDALAAHIEGLIGQEELKSQMIQNARETVEENYSWPRIIQNVEQTYVNLLDGGESRHS